MKKLFSLIFIYIAFLLPIYSKEDISFIPALAKYLVSFEINNSFSGINEIDQIYVINLVKRKDKWERIQNIANKNHLNVNRFNAINGWSIPKSDQRLSVRLDCQELRLDLDLLLAGLAGDSRFH